MALAVACAASAAPAAAPAVAGAACRSVKIAGRSTCLAAGTSCKPKYEAKYESKGFACKRNAKGEYKLKRMKQAF